MAALFSFSACSTQQAPEVRRCDLSARSQSIGAWCKTDRGKPICLGTDTVPACSCRVKSSRKGGEMKKVIPVLFLLFGVTMSTLYAGGESKTATDQMVTKDLLIKSEVETAISMLEAIEMKHQQGEMTFNQAKKLGADLLRVLRYGDEGYFWADTEEGVNVVLYGRKDVEGKNRLNAKDPNGVYYIKEFIALAKSGGGYAEYYFPKMEGSKPQPKRSYVMLFKPFGWVVGSGYYKK